MISFKMRLGVCILFVFIFVVYQQAVASTLTWDPPAEGQVSGYKVHYGTAANSYPDSIDVGNVTAYSLDELSLTPGTTYYFAVTAYDGSTESDYSSSVSFKPSEPDDTTPPIPPGWVKVETVD